MALTKQMFFNEINRYFKEKRTLFFVLNNGQFVQVNNAALCITNPEDVSLLRDSYFHSKEDVFKNLQLWKTEIDSTEQLARLCKQYNLSNIIITNVGSVVYNNLKMALQENFVVSKMLHKLDNENLVWLGFSDGTQYRINDALCIYFNEAEAINKAKEIGAFPAKHSIIAPLFEEILDSRQQYNIDGHIIPGIILMSGIKRHFKETMLDFNMTKRYIEQGLSVFAGKGENGFDMFANYKMSTFFSPNASLSLIDALTLREMPEGSNFFPVRNTEALYTFSNSDYVCFDCSYHTDIATFENAIDGKEYTIDWTYEQQKAISQDLFNQQFLYIILSDLNYNAERKTSWPNIINAYHRKSWIFKDYGKALMFCQQKHYITNDGLPLIGLLSNNVRGIDLHSTLSLLLHNNVTNIELNPMEDDRVLLNIEDMLEWQGLTKIPKKEIVRTDPKDPYKTYEDDDDEFVFNGILLT